MEVHAPQHRVGPELADPAAAARRATSRAGRVSAGLDDLDRWLGDQVRSGLNGMDRAGYAYFDAVAARMVDAQAPGIAGILRSIPVELAGVDWPDRVLSQLGSLHLLIQAHRHLHLLPADLAATIRSRIGYPVSKTDVLAGPGISDRWLALGMVDTAEFRLETRRVWLYGSTTSQWALWLSFAPPGGRLDASVLPGQVLDADLHFYPGSGQYRVLIGDRRDGGEDRLQPSDRPCVESFALLQRRFADLVAADPWASRMPAVVEAAPIPSGEPRKPWRLRDSAGSVCELADLGAEPWPLVARSGGAPIRIFGEWNGRALRAVSLMADDHGLPFSTSVLGRAA
jgi:hypothetical protein